MDGGCGTDAVMALEGEMGLSFEFAGAIFDLDCRYFVQRDGCFEFACSIDRA